MFLFVTKIMKVLAVKHPLVYIFDPSRSRRVNTRPLIHSQVRRTEILRVIKMTGWRPPGCDTMWPPNPHPSHLKSLSYALVLIRVKNVFTFSCYDPFLWDQCSASQFLSYHFHALLFICLVVFVGGQTRTTWICLKSWSVILPNAPRVANQLRNDALDVKLNGIVKGNKFSLLTTTLSETRICPLNE